MEYTRDNAKEWAYQNFHGVCNVIIPSYTADLKQLNEKGIRHDVRRNIELGFWGALLVSEVGTSADEMRQFMEIAVDEAKGRHRFLLHGMFDTADDIVKMAQDACRIGVDGMLLGHPNSFYPKDCDQLYEYLSYVADHTDIAIVLFAANHWNFHRLHPSGYPTDVLVKAADLPNVVAIKYEVGRPGIAGDYEFWKMTKGKRILFCDPFEPHCPVTVEMFGQQWMGTSNFEYCGGAIPREFKLLREGRYEEAMKIYWQIQPARVARMAEHATFAGANFIHRYLWKFQAWLHGYNGGPLRQPVMKLNDGQMRRLRDSLVRSRMEPAEDDLTQFFVGRNPA
ncbi:MAG: dihydrodipicolinate synthase family protein [Nitrospiraceae bacterium]